MKSIQRKTNRYIVALTLLLLISVRIYLQFVPWGADFTPYVSYSVPGPTLKSPAGKIFEVHFNDAGGMHSGNHWTWVVESQLLLGKRVVESGYLGPEHVNGDTPLDVQWNGEQPVLPFRSGRHE